MVCEDGEIETSIVITVLLVY